MSDLLRASRELLAYTIWADRTLLDGLRQVSTDDFLRDTGTSHGSLRGTLVHILVAQQRWLARFLGESAPAAVDAVRFPDRLTVSLAFEELWSQLEFFIAGLTDEQLGSDLTWLGAGGERRTRQLWHAVLHLVNHSTYHRGQVVCQLRQLGYSSPATDLISFTSERAAAGGG